MSIINNSAIPFPENNNNAKGKADNNTPTYRIIPHNIEAEQALLGTLLLKNTTLEQVGEILKPEYFFDPSHQKIYAAICQLIDKGQVANPVVLKNYFANDEMLEKIGGAAYLAELASNVISIINAEHYAKLIHELYIKRQLIEIGEDLVNKAYDHDLNHSAQSQIEECERTLFELATIGDIQGGFEKFSDSINHVIKMAEIATQRKGQLTGVTTGMRDMDKLLGGLQKTDLIILAGRPSMGKTSLATNIACNAAKAHALNKGREGAVVGFFSLEMSAEQLALRIIAEESQIPSHRIRKGEIEKDEFERLSNASCQLTMLPIFTDDTPAITISALRSRARRLKRNHGLDLLIVDYLQLLRGSSKGSENRVLEISEITRGLKAIAKELNIPVLALSQLSRAVEQRDDKRPQLSDLRESGSIEQDADIVMFVYREQYYHERTMPNKKSEEDELKFQEKLAQWEQHGREVENIAEVIIAKQRQGPIGTVKLHFDANLTKFSDLDIIHHAQN